MNMKQVFALSGALAVMLMLTSDVANGIGMGCGMGYCMDAGTGDKNDSAVASMPCMSDMANHSSMTMTDTSSAMGCHMMIEGAMMTVKNIPNGVQIELTGTDSATIASIRAHARHILAMRNGMSDTVTSRPRTGNKSLSTRPAQTATYTCPMHPEVVSTRPGQCPKCGMTLVHVR